MPGACRPRASPPPACSCLNPGNEALSCRGVRGRINVGLERDGKGPGVGGTELPAQGPLPVHGPGIPGLGRAELSPPPHVSSCALHVQHPK